MRIIDAHAHVFDLPGYVEGLLEKMDSCGIEKACVSGLGPMFKCLTNQGIKDLIDMYPDRFIGVWYIRPGVNDASEVDKAVDLGFKMLKVTIPRKPYDDPSYFPIWERAQAKNLPVLFHTGVITMVGEHPGEHISSWNMHPMRIEPVTRAFPDLNVIIAHLGVHWNADAAELARMRKTVYVDLTGEPGGWRARLDREGADKYLWWPGAFKKVVFGTDVHHDNIKQVIVEDMSRLDILGIDQATRERIFSKTILKLLNDVS